MAETKFHPLEAILRMCAAAAPSPWFPKAYSVATGIAADDLLFFLEHLWLEGLIQKSGGSSETGPGFTLTEAGQRVLQDPALLERLRSGSIRPEGDRGAIVREAIRNPPRAIVSRALVAANLLVFAYGFYLALPKPAVRDAFLSGPWFRQAQAGMAAVVGVLHVSGALRGEDLLRGEWWRLLSCGFVHVGVLHLAMNMYALYVMGWQVESMWGRWRFLVIYLAGVVGGSCAMVAAHPATLGAGASGALCGLIASEAIWLLLNRRYFPWALVARWRSGLTTTLILIVLISLAPGVSGWAHLGGALAGGVAAWLLNVQRFGRPPWRWLALAGVPLVFISSLAALDRARTTQESWHELEIRDAVRRLVLPAAQDARAADQEYRENAARLLQRHAKRRRSEDIAKSLEAMRKQEEVLNVLKRTVSATGPYRFAVAEEGRQELLEALDAELAVRARTAQCLEKGPDCTKDDENKVDEARKSAVASWKRALAIARVPGPRGRN